MATLDRRCTIKIEAEGKYVKGRYVPGPVTDHPRWCSYQDAGTNDIFVSGESRTAIAAQIIVRYDQAIYLGELTRMRCVIHSDTDREFDVDSMAELGRREWISMQLIEHL